MASLVNCEIVDTTTVQVGVGIADISNQTLTIIPSEGYVLDKSLLVWEDQNHPQVESIKFENENRLTGELGVEGFLPGVNVVATINLYDTYSISEDTTITVDLSCTAEKFVNPYKKVRLYLFEDGSRRVNETIEVAPYDSDTAISVVKVDPSPTTGTDTYFKHYNGNQTTENGHHADFVYEITVNNLENNSSYRPVATIVCNAINPDSESSQFFCWGGVEQVGGGSFNLKMFNNGGSSIFSHDYEDVWQLSFNESKSILNDQHGAWTTVAFDLHYKAQDTFSTYEFNDSSLSSSGDVGSYFNNQDWNRTIFFNQPRILSLINRGAATHFINDVDVKFDKEGFFNNMPISGLVEGTKSQIKISGEIGAQFTISLKELGETLVNITQPEGVSTKTLPVNISNTDYFGGEETVVANVDPVIKASDITSLDVYQIPDDGVVAFNFPNISAYTGDGYRTFELEVKSYGTTAISSNANQTDGGSIENGDTINSVLKSLYYQLPNVYIQVAAIKDSSWNWNATYSGAPYTSSSGSGIGTGRMTGARYDLSEIFGKPGGRVSDLPYVTSLDKNTQIGKETNSFATIQFTVEVAGGSGDFSFTPEVEDVLDEEGNSIGQYTFDADSVIKAVLANNGDIVNFSNTYVYIGTGVDDVSADRTQSATVKINYNPERFGRLPQKYEVDLTKILQYK